MGQGAIQPGYAGCVLPCNVTIKNNTCQCEMDMASCDPDIDVDLRRLDLASLCQGEVAPIGRMTRRPRDVDDAGDMEDASAGGPDNLGHRGQREIDHGVMELDKWLSSEIGDRTVQQQADKLLVKGTSRPTSRVSSPRSPRPNRGDLTEVDPMDQVDPTYPVLAPGPWPSFQGFGGPVHEVAEPLESPGTAAFSGSPRTSSSASTSVISSAAPALAPAFMDLVVPVVPGNADQFGRFRSATPTLPPNRGDQAHGLHAHMESRRVTFSTEKPQQRAASPRDQGILWHLMTDAAPKGNRRSPSRKVQRGDPYEQGSDVGGSFLRPV
mmetsp:Transcript_13692/g.24702  ORF Transcript_13692/g.24702 Transcript_13692/m.24702 type:complete len:324 (+) Transcript_13692:224-1195(+)